MNSTSRQERLARSRRHRSWANANQLKVSTSSEAPENASVNSVQDEEERKQKLRDKVSPSRFSSAAHKTNDPSSPSRAGNQNTPSMASRRQRMEAIAKRPGYSSPRHQKIFRQTPQDSPEAQPSETIESNDGREEGPPVNKISQRIKNFERDVASPSKILASKSWNHQHPYRSQPKPTTQRANDLDDVETTSEASSTLPPPPPPAEPTNKFKSWSEWEQKNKSLNVGRVSRSPAARSPSPVAHPHHFRGAASRVVVPRSPTPSIGSVDSSFSAPKQSNTYKNNWNGSPEVQRSFAAPVKHVSSQPRKSAEVSMYKSMLKPVQREEAIKKSHEKEAYGAIIETPEKSSVSSLHAMFNSQKSTPLMPMNSTDKRVRQTLPQSPSTPSKYRSPVVVKPTADHNAESPMASQSPRNSQLSSWYQRRAVDKQDPPKPAGNSRVKQYYNSSWRIDNTNREEKKAEEEDETNKTTQEEETKSTSVVSSWQERCKPRRIDLDVPDSPLRSDIQEVQETRRPSQAEVASVSSAAISSMMYSSNQKSLDFKKDTETKPPLRAEPTEVSSSVLASLMYSTKKLEEKKPVFTPQPVAVDWPSEENPEEASNVRTHTVDTKTDIVSDTTDVPIEAEEEAAHDMDQQIQKKSSGSIKPWESDTKNSVVQSWQMRTSRSKDSSQSSLPGTGSQEEPHSLSHEGGDHPIEESAPAVVEENPPDPPDEELPPETIDPEPLPQVLTGSSEDDSFLEEKKSGDLSIDEDAILGEDESGNPIHKTEIRDPSSHPLKNPSFYDDDSYLSRGDTVSRTIGASASFKSASARSRVSGAPTYNSEDMSVYVEDDRILTKKEDKILSAQFEQLNLEVAVGAGDELDSPALPDREEAMPAATVPINVTTPKQERLSLPRINPSPKDNDRYRTRYFEDTRVATPQKHEPEQSQNSKTSVDRENSSVYSRRSTDIQVFDVWGSSEASNEERDEAIKFDETDQWLDRDPDIEESLAGEDISDSSDVEKTIESTVRKEPEPRPIAIRRPPESLRTLERQRMQANKSATKQAKTHKQEVFDPFGPDAEEDAGGLTVDVTEDLFSSNPDPFSSDDQFSPLEWSSPRGAASNKNPQHIGYYNSPNSRAEI